MIGKMTSILPRTVRLTLLASLAGVQVAWAQPNRAPVARDDSATVSQGNTVIIPVLANDYDPDGDPLTVQSVRRAKGIVHILEDGTLSYRPTPNFIGEDIFEYTITDGRKGRARARVMVRVTAAQANHDPVALDNVAATDEDAPVTVAVLDNDSDPDEDALSVASVTQGANGSAAINPDGTVTYTPNENFNGSDSFTYTVSDGNGGTASAGVTITVKAVNDAPVITSPATATATEDELFTYTATASDVDDATVTITFSNLPGWLTADGSTVSGTPGEDIFSATFTITADDGHDANNTATLEVTVTVGPVNDTPVADDKSVTTDEDTAADIVLSGTDPEGTTLSYNIAADPTSGSLSGEAPNLTYTPEENYNGDDTFTYTVDDGVNTSAEATVTITIEPVNDAPVAVDDTASTQEDVAVIIEVLKNDYDVDGDPLVVQNVRQAQGKRKILIDRVNGTLLYTPSPNFSGEDVFYYTVRDAAGAEDEGMVTVTVGGVNDPPVAYDTTATVAEDGNVSVTLRGFDAEGDGLTFTIATYPAHGELTGDAPDLTYTPSENYYGEDAFTYTVSDGKAESNTATVSITVTPVNDAPVITSPATAEATEDEIFNYTTSATDVDDEDSAITFDFSGLPGWLTAEGATVSGTPGEGDGSVTFTITADDGHAENNTATLVVTLTVNAVNDPPVAYDQAATTDEDAAKPIVLTGSDPEEATLIYTVVEGPFHGTLSGDAPSLTYQPAPDYFGDDAFAFTVNDGVQDSEPATVTVTVDPVNDAPVALDDAYSMGADEILTVDALSGVLANDSDLENDPLTAVLVAGPSEGSLTLDPDGSFTYTPPEGYNGTDTFTYTASDGDLPSNTATVTITVNLADVAESEPIGAVGGSFNAEFGDDLGASIVVPPGAVSGSVNLQIGLYDTPPAGANLIGPVFFFGPSGATFDSPVTITVSYDPDLLPLGFDLDSLVLLIYSENDETWEEALNSVVDTEAYTVTGQTYHFSGFAAGLPLNRAPQVVQNLPDPVINEDARSTVIIENLADYFADSNFGDQIDFDVTSLDEGLHAVYVTDESALVVDPKPNFYGDIRIVITATDLTGLSVSDTLFLTVVADNDPPAFPPGFRAALAEVMTLQEDQVLRIRLMASDVEGDDVTFNATSDTSAVTAAVAQDTMLVVIPAPNWHGIARIGVSATDGQDTTYLDPVTLTVSAVNDDPPSPFALLEPADETTIHLQPVDLGESLTFAWAETVDPDGDPVSYTLMLSDSGAFSLELEVTGGNVVRVSYADLVAAIRDQELTTATFWWTIVATSGQHTTVASDSPYSLTIDIGTLDVRDMGQLPQFFMLHQNYPNPFNPLTTLKYETPIHSRVLLVIYDMRGIEVIRLVDGYVGAGYNRVVWNSSDAAGRPVPSGIYFARLITLKYTHTIKLTLIR